MMPGLRSVLLPAAVMALTAMACSISDGGVGPDSALSTVTLDCTNPIDVLAEPPTDWVVVGDVVALPAGQILERGPVDDEEGRAFSKFGLVIRADAVFSMTVAADSLPNALIGWGTNSSTPAAAVDVPGCPGLCRQDDQPDCPAGEVGRWVVYPGGVATMEPSCVSIEVGAGADSTTARLPVGVACP